MLQSQRRRKRSSPNSAMNALHAPSDRPTPPCVVARTFARPYSCARQATQRAKRILWPTDNNPAEFIRSLSKAAFRASASDSVLLKSEEGSEQVHQTRPPHVNVNEGGLCGRRSNDANGGCFPPHTCFCLREEQYDPLHM